LPNEGYEGYSLNASCPLDYISTVLLLCSLHCSTKKGYIAQDDLYLAKTTLIGRNLGICYCVPKSNRKIAATGISVPIVHISITAHFPDLAQGVQCVRVNSTFMCHNLP
jgi:hypothetical protein